MFDRKANLERRLREGRQAILDAWLAKQTANEWRGSASDFADELLVVADQIGALAYTAPSAFAAVRWLEQVETPGWTWTSKRATTGRVITFERTQHAD